MINIIVIFILRTIFSNKQIYLNLNTIRILKLKNLQLCMFYICLAKRLKAVIICLFKKRKNTSVIKHKFAYD